MLDFTIEIFCELLLLLTLFTLIADTSRYYKTHNQARIIIQTLLQAIKSRTTESKYQLLIERKYLSSFWERLNKSFDKRLSLFNKVVIKFHKLCERKGIIAFILEGLHQQKKPILEKNDRSA